MHALVDMLCIVVNYSKQNLFGIKTKVSIGARVA